MKKLFVVVLLLTAININAQWVSVGPWGGGLYGIGFNNSGLYVLTTHTIYRSTDNGNTWIGSLLTVNGNSHIIYRNSTDDKFIVTNNVMLYISMSGIAKSTDNGLNWTEYGLFSGINGATLKGSDLFITTESASSVYRSTNYGENWIEANGDFTAGVHKNGITAFGGNLFVASDSGIYKSNNSGLNWSKCFNGRTERFGQSLNTIFVTTRYDSTMLYRTTNGGTTWTKADAGLNCNLIYNIHTKDNIVYVSSYDSGIYRSTNNGVTWNRFHKGIMWNSYYYSFANFNNYVFAGPLYGCGIFKSLSTDTSWTKSSGNFSTLNFQSFTRSGLKLYAGGYDGLYVSTNEGASWDKPVNFDYTGTVQCLYNIDKTTYQVLFATVDSALFRTTNSGTSWQRIAYPKGNYGQIISMYYTNNTLFAGLSNHQPSVIRSSDLGLTWSTSGTGIQNNFVHCFLNYNNYLFAGTGGGVYFSSNMGYNWVSRSNGMNGGMVIPTIIDDNNRLLVTHSNGLYYSIDLGLNWTLLPENSNHLYRVTKFGNNLFGTNMEEIFMSTNSGVSWIPKNQGLYTRGQMALYFDNTYVFLMTSNGGIWRRLISDVVSVKNISTELPSSYSLGQNYPNPFNSTSNLKFQIENTGDVKLIVYDIMGKEVQTLVNERLQPGTYEAAFDGSALNSGVYFYRLSTSDFTETKKMVLIK